MRSRSFPCGSGSVGLASQHFDIEIQSGKQLQNTKFDPGAEYFSHLRMSLLSLAKGKPRRVLEVGCGHGQSLAYFKQSRGTKFTAGVEYVPEVAAVARLNAQVDEVITGDIESLCLPFQPGDFDLIIAGHVLEHVKDPWAVTRTLRTLLKPNGQFIGSLPNVRNVKVSLPLLMFGRWKYEDEGILDWTHTKFFTRMTIRDLLTSSGFGIERIVPELGPTSVFIDRLSLGVFRDLLGWTFNFSAFPALDLPR
jgi:SAM-dependent methyltransferase